MGLIRLVRSLFGRGPKKLKKRAFELGTLLGEQLRRSLQIGCPHVSMKYDVDPMPSGSFTLDIWLDDHFGNSRFIVIEYDQDRNNRGLDPYGCSDCTDDEDGMYGDGCRFSCPQPINVEVWFRRHVKWMMPHGDA